MFSGDLIHTYTYFDFPGIPGTFDFPGIPGTFAFPGIPGFFIISAHFSLSFNVHKGFLSIRSNRSR